MFLGPVDYFRIYRRRPSLGEGRTAAFVFIATAPSFARWPPDFVFGSAQRFLVGLRSRANAIAMRLREGVEVRPTLIDETFAVRAELTGCRAGQRPA